MLGRGFLLCDRHRPSAALKRGDVPELIARVRSAMQARLDDYWRATADEA